MLSLKLTLSLLTTLPVAIAGIYEHFSDIPSKDFDFIIIGGGTAGNAVANRLTENPKFSVLLLEAGGSNENVLLSEVPMFCGRATPNTAIDWNYTTTPQKALDGRVLPYGRGFILGGTSSVNCMFYTRGSSEDYDRFAKITNDPGWAWDNIQQYIRKNERFTIESRNDSSKFDPRFHGFQGVNSVTLPQTHHEWDTLAVQASQESPVEFPLNPDYNSGFQLGMGWVQSTIKEGVRSSSATSYLAAEFVNRPNLNVLLHARVTRVIPSNSHKGSLMLTGVEFTQDAGVSKRVLYAQKEVILSAGVFGTPSILLHSGIGDAQALSNLGIPVVHDLPSVGKNLSEQSSSRVTWQVNTTDTTDDLARNSTVADQLLAEWMESHTGRLGDGPSNHIGFFRVNTTGTPFEGFPDPAAGPNTSHFELILIDSAFRQVSPTGNFLSILTAVVSPTSRGTVTINSTNPLDPPLIDPNLFSSDFDMFVMREAIGSARRFMSAPAWDNLIIASTLNATTDEELNDYFRQSGGLSEHAVGTAAMSARGASWGVADPDLKVKGVNGLRIVDASVMPFVTASHTQAPTYIIAERASDLIKNVWM